MRLLILLCFFHCLVFGSLFGQTPDKNEGSGPTIIRTDTTGFPTLKVVFGFEGLEAPNDSDFKVIDENRVEVPFSISTEEGDTAVGNNRIVFFLVEQSQQTAGNPFDNIKKALVRVLERFDDSDKINFGFFGKEDSDDKSLDLVSTDFSSNYTRFKQDVQGRELVKEDSVQSNGTDIYKAIYDALDFFESQNQLNGKKMLIVLASASSNTKSTYSTQDLTDKARKLNIPIHTIAFKTNSKSKPDNFRLLSDRSNGSSIVAKTAFDIREGLNKFLDQASNKKSENSKNYALSFVTEVPTDGRIHQFELIYKGDSQIINYTSPSRVSRGTFWSDYGILLMIVMGVGVAYGIWWYRENRMNKGGGFPEDDFERQMAYEQSSRSGVDEEALGKIRDLENQNLQLREQMRNLQQEVAEIPIYQQPPKFDMKKTVISGGGGAPQFLVSSGAGNQSYQLNKLEMSIGRGEENDIKIPEQTVSKNHAVLKLENGSFFIEDKGSTNGTFINGSRIQKQVLKSGDIIKLGAVICKFQL